MKFIEWLKGLFTKPKEEKSEMTDQVVEVQAAQPAAAADVQQATPAAEVQTGVKDLKAALEFLDDGIKHLGEGAKDELVALAQKYL